MTEPSRRTALKRTSALVATAIATGLLRPSDALADWNKGAFESKTVADALKNLKVAAPADTKDIVIRAPDIAENGAVVPIEIQSNIPGTRSISVLIEKNPFPYVATFDLAQGAALPFVALRVKMGETSNVRVVAATADGKFHSAVKEVKVTIGGCGG
ncbi:MAG: thiosulfate oxidation carrier protein SoxY [Burkholderiales bacterium]|jgi:sulfur-oxidizing protein SoxY